MPPCCQIPPKSPHNFRLSLDHAAKDFSQYVGGGNRPINRPFPDPKYLTSGLHLEMILWRPTGVLPWPYKPNDAVGNSWTAMSKRTGPLPFDQDQWTEAWPFISAKFPARKACALIEYDRWILKQIIGIRRFGNGNASSTFGKAQKLINICIKYELCWQVAGQWHQAPGDFTAYKPLFNLQDFLCALHAPIDRILIKILAELPIGQYLRKNHFLRKSGDIRQTLNGQVICWSQLYCLRTYYGLQLLVRRIVMRTWPKGCSCSPQNTGLNQCIEMFGNEFTEGKFKGPDWLDPFGGMRDEQIDQLIDETIVELEKRYSKRENKRKHEERHGKDFEGI